MPALTERVADVEFHLAQLADAQLKTEIAVQGLSREMREFKNEMSDFKREAEADRRRMNKAWGDLANKMGTVLEDIVAPNIKRLALERFGCDPLDSFIVGIERRGLDGSMREFDVLAVGATRIVFAESKSTISERAITDVVEKVRTFFDHFPEWGGRELIPVIATWRVKNPSHAELNAYRIFGVEMGDDTMELINDGEF